jgi:hypothetical protein
MVNKTFNGDLDIFINKIKNHENFSLTRFGDGELKIIDGEPIDISLKFNGEHKYDPTDSSHVFFQKKMLESLEYQNDSYFVGLPCSCCVGIDSFNRIVKQSKQPANRLTWANIFVNSNYQKFCHVLLPMLKNEKIVLISHEKSDLSKIPFNPINHVKIGANAWIQDYHKIEEIKEIAKNVKDCIFLFAAGTFSNLAILECHKLNTKNTFLDIGSTLDVMLGLGATRKYLKNGNTLTKTCIW